jgi:hypothetical protein
MNPYIFLSSLTKKVLPILIIGFAIFSFGGGLSYIMALITNQASRDQVYFILTTPTMTIYLSMLTLGGWMMFIDSPRRMVSAKPRLGKIEFFLGLVLIALSYMSIEILFRGGI